MRTSGHYKCSVGKDVFNFEVKGKHIIIACIIDGVSMSIASGVNCKLNCSYMYHIRMYMYRYNGYI